MFAIIAVGDRQYKVVVGEACVFEKIDKQEGEDITMSGLLLLSNDGEVLSKKE
ncbi:MAG: bL21 family ribosomal protein, partial [Rickettsiales bacterium]|nr:bL21 family ribosomal protein [Rickettsiales bacterium]